MRVICIFLTFICLCAGCKGNNGHAAATQKDKIATGMIINKKPLPETGAQQIKPPKEIKAPAPKILKGQEAPKALMPQKSQEPKPLVSNTGNF